MCPGAARRRNACGAAVRTGRRLRRYVDGEEAVAEDYRDRGGYQADFLGIGKLAVAPTAVQRNADDILDFQVQRETETELRYEHYSVVMSRSRRMCFSARSISTAQSVEEEQAGRLEWDPRIPKAQADHERVQ